MWLQTPALPKYLDFRYIDVLLEWRRSFHVICVRCQFWLTLKGILCRPIYLRCAMRFQIKSVLLNHSMVFRRTLNHFKSSLKVHLCDYSYYVWNLKVTERCTMENQTNEMPLYVWANWRHRWYCLLVSLSLYFFS